MAWALLVLVAWLAATVSGAAGFGGALLLLPILAAVVGPEWAVPVLTVAQLLGNASRAWFGRREIRWRPALAFVAGAIPATVLGGRLFVELPSAVLLRAMGAFLLGVVVFRRTSRGRGSLPPWTLPVAGSVVGFLSAVVGSAGPLGAAVFLGLKLPAVAYVSTEAVTATAMHIAKVVVYGRYSAIDAEGLGQGLLLGGAMVVGSWTGRRFIERMPPAWFGRLVEGLMVAAALTLLVG